MPRRAVPAGTADVKKIRVCAPTPDRNTSSPAGTFSAPAALTYPRVRQRRRTVEVSGPEQLSRDGYAASSRAWPVPASPPAHLGGLRTYRALAVDYGRPHDRFVGWQRRSSWSRNRDDAIRFLGRDEAEAC